MELIDKADLVAEIEKRECLLDLDNPLGRGGMAELEFLKNIINSLEVKEVDFETSFAASIDHFDEKNNYGQWPESDLKDFAKHFFELGLNTQKEK